MRRARFARKAELRDARRIEAHALRRRDEKLAVVQLRRDTGHMRVRADRGAGSVHLIDERLFKELEERKREAQVEEAALLVAPRSAEQPVEHGDEDVRLELCGRGFLNVNI